MSGERNWAPPMRCPYLSPSVLICSPSCIRSDGIEPSCRFLQAAEKELIAFERRERDFLRKDREEQAAKLQFPLDGFARN